MPNWCENDLYVYGEKSELEKFKEAVGGADRHGEEKLICEDKIIPYPEHFRLLDMANPLIIGKVEEEASDKRLQLTEEQEESLKQAGYDLTKDGFNQGGHEWCVENWGTKWGFAKVELEEERDDELKYTFDTAWSPPLPLVKKMGEMFPKLKLDLRYFEAGAGYNGLYSIENSQVVFDESGTYFGDRGG